MLTLISPRNRELYVIIKYNKYYVIYRGRLMTVIYIRKTFPDAYRQPSSNQNERENFDQYVYTYQCASYKI